jgi:hypothetical protein
MGVNNWRTGNNDHIIKKLIVPIFSMNEPALSGSLMFIKFIIVSQCADCSLGSRSLFDWQREMVAHIAL